MSNTMIPKDWDTDVIDYWNASLSSYQKHHDVENEEEQSSELVTSSFLDSLPVKAKQDIPKQPSPTKEPVQQESRTEKVESTQEAQVGLWSNVEEPVDDPEEEVEEEVYYEEEEEEVYYEEEIDATEVPYQPDTTEEERRERPIEETGKKRQSKKPRYEPPLTSSTAPPAPAPPPPPMMGQDEGLSNLMMAWYYAGYYTGLYQAGQRQ
ncbi:uncharacterized protein EV154DRAFT_518629 [Mucor mucedo]|uniref:uncharacterized protein n=1 Tax=Mucor mucedo TaxID=29922 RepID=UPI002220119F|nr:uncharacterized protein EV154DRAFT_518629 [Mucor mucedo]KAI7888084.1 hypothetical protein EV154DRAFT_518629 [Mucor mucedo]